MRRRLFNLAAVVSLVVCVATMALWVLSYCGWQVIHLPTPGPDIALDSFRGTIRLLVNPRQVRSLGGASGTVVDFVFEIPWWPVTLATSVLPAWWAGRQIKARRQSKLGLCPSCGYDLRATPDRCPECGTTVN